MSSDLAVFKVYEYQDQFDLMYECSDEVNTDINGEKYEMVTQTLADDDFYQGLNMTTVIRRKSDGKLFGYHWWDDISKHGEPYVEANGSEFDYDGDSELDEDGISEVWYSYYVFQPVEKWVYEGYRTVS